MLYFLKYIKVWSNLDKNKIRIIENQFNLQHAFINLQIFSILLKFIVYFFKLLLFFKLLKLYFLNYKIKVKNKRILFYILPQFSQFTKRRCPISINFIFYTSFRTCLRTRKSYRCRTPKVFSIYFERFFDSIPIQFSNYTRPFQCIIVQYLFIHVLRFLAEYIKIV